MRRTPLRRTKSLAPVSAKKRSKTVKRKRPDVKVLGDGREVCNLNSRVGAQEYHNRKWMMWERQGYRCCLEGFIEGCPGYLPRCQTTFEHEDGRGLGGAKRDDRIEKDGQRYNGAAHLQCNCDKGSRFIDYNRRQEMAS